MAKEAVIKSKATTNRMKLFIIIPPKGKQWNHSITGRGEFNPICLSFVTHGVTHNKKGPNGKPLSPCFKWSGREDLNLRPPAPKAGALARLRHAPILVHSKIYNRLL